MLVIYVNRYLQDFSFIVEYKIVIIQVFPYQLAYKHRISLTKFKIIDHLFMQLYHELLYIKASDCYTFTGESQG